MSWPPDFDSIVAEYQTAQFLATHLRQRVHQTKGHFAGDNQVKIFRTDVPYSKSEVDRRIAELENSIKEGFFLKLIGRFEAEVISRLQGARIDIENFVNVQYPGPKFTSFGKNFVKSRKEIDTLAALLKILAPSEQDPGWKELRIIIDQRDYYAHGQRIRPPSQFYTITQAAEILMDVARQL